MNTTRVRLLIKTSKDKMMRQILQEVLDLNELVVCQKDKKQGVFTLTAYRKGIEDKELIARLQEEAEYHQLTCQLIGDKKRGNKKMSNKIKIEA
ncbi:hypothetical protein CN918_31060 [Priestia megaterium]|nr:hypothetical protein CN918_31060 [Priestia megaterium]